VPPDIEVVDDPAKMQHGEDLQLDQAIAVMLSELDGGKGWKQPKVPDYPNRTGMGVSAIEQR
jgi:hypothetical protein